MAELSTKYMGLELRNPLIVGSCSLVKSVDGVAKCADAGAGAVVVVTASGAGSPASRASRDRTALSRSSSAAAAMICSWVL